MPSQKPATLRAGRQQLPAKHAAGNCGCPAACCNLEDGLPGCRGALPHPAQCHDVCAASAAQSGFHRGHRSLVHDLPLSVKDTLPYLTPLLSAAVRSRNADADSCGPESAAAGQGAQQQGSAGSSHQVRKCDNSPSPGARSTCSLASGLGCRRLAVRSVFRAIVSCRDVEMPCLGHSAALHRLCRRS